MSRKRGKRCPTCGDRKAVRTENTSKCPDPVHFDRIMHAKVSCAEMPATTHFSGKSYSVKFECPSCHRTGRFNLSYLGPRRVICDGIKFTKVAREELGSRIRLSD
jgi:predicted RNA-binding Zn-ribbon protein involved in translation (DUF1610 family)